MRRYLLGGLGGYLLSCLIAWGMLALAILNWFFSEPPLWFDVLALMLGLLLALGVMALLWAAWTLGAHVLLLVNVPCAMLAEMAADWLDLKYRWGYQVYDRFLRHLLGLAGHLSLPLLYHLFWVLGRRRDAKNKG